MTNEAIHTRTEGHTRFRRRTLLLVAAVIAVSIVSFAFRDRGVEVQVVSPLIGDIESTVSTTGRVAPSFDFPARSTFAGIVDRIYVHVGQRVHRGQLLVEMRDQYAASRLAGARAALRSAELSDQNVQSNGSKEDQIAEASDLERARSDQALAAQTLSTVEQLRRSGSASDAEVFAATQRKEAADAALDAATQRSRSRYREADIRSAEAKVAADKLTLAAEDVSYRNAHIQSPISGTVYLVPVNQYDFVQMGADLLHVADLTNLIVRASFFEPDIAQLHINDPVRVTWAGAPGRTWYGRLISRPMAVTTQGEIHTGECTASVRASGSDLPINTNVTVVVTLDKHTHVLTLPREAVHMEGSQHFVYRVVGSRLKKTPVRVGLINPSEIEITSGLNSRDRVVLHARGSEQLKDNMRVSAGG